MSLVACAPPEVSPTLGLLWRKQVLPTFSSLTCWLVGTKGVAGLGWAGAQERGRSPGQPAGSGAWESGQGPPPREAKSRSPLSPGGATLGSKTAELGSGKTQEGKMSKEGPGPLLLSGTPHYLL